MLAFYILSVAIPVFGLGASRYILTKEWLEAKLCAIWFLGTFVLWGYVAAGVAGLGAKFYPLF